MCLGGRCRACGRSILRAGDECGIRRLHRLEQLYRRRQGLGGVFAEYSRQRVANGQAIADMAVDNYFEMRHRVGDPNGVQETDRAQTRKDFP